MKYFLGKRFLLVWLCATAIALSTCSYIPPTNLKAPGLSLSDLALKEFSSERVKLIVTMSAANTNAVDIPLSNLKLDLSLLDTAIASGVATQPEILIPKNGEAKVPIEFTIQPRQITEMLRKVSFNDLMKMRYAMKGSASWNGGPFSLPFERKGEFTGFQKFGDVLRLLRP